MDFTQSRFVHFPRPLAPHSAAHLKEGADQRTALHRRQFLRTLLRSPTTSSGWVDRQSEEEGVCRLARTVARESGQEQTDETAGVAFAGRTRESPSSLALFPIPRATADKRSLGLMVSFSRFGGQGFDTLPEPKAARRLPHPKSPLLSRLLSFSFPSLLHHHHLLLLGPPTPDHPSNPPSPAEEASLLPARAPLPSLEHCARTGTVGVERRLPLRADFVLEFRRTSRGLGG